MEGEITGIKIEKRYFCEVLAMAMDINTKLQLFSSQIGPPHRINLLLASPSDLSDSEFMFSKSNELRQLRDDALESLESENCSLKSELHSQCSYISKLEKRLSHQEAAHLSELEALREEKEEEMRIIVDKITNEMEDILVDKEKEYKEREFNMLRDKILKIEKENKGLK